MPKRQSCIFYFISWRWSCCKVFCRWRQFL